MKRLAFLILAGYSVLSALPRHVASFHQNASPRPSSALVDPNDRVFSDVVAGGGWETIITFVNMSGSPAQFTLTFYDDNGNLLKMPLVIPDGSVSRFASADFALDPNTSSEVVVANIDSTITSGWTYLSFSSGTSAIAGLAVVRAKDSKGNVISESTESLSNTQDFDFYAPYDNLEGIASGLILVNPGNTLTANVRISAQDASGAEILRDHVQLPAGSRVTIVLPDSYSALAGTSGKLRVTGDTNNLSAICFRTSPSGNVAYSPIFNWSGMFLH
jgi:hypothetical protein